MPDRSCATSNTTGEDKLKNKSQISTSCCETKHRLHFMFDNVLNHTCTAELKYHTKCRDIEKQKLLSRVITKLSGPLCYLSSYFM